MIDGDHVEALLQASARAGEAVTYSEVLGALGFSFSRPKMRALCKTLDDIDARARGRGEPELAVLVVRQSDRLPGQGWWVGGRPARDGYKGEWEGPKAAAYIRKVQAEVFGYWGANTGRRVNRIG
ncbi:ribose-phosphate pyrophosphokinase [Sphingoaurantiacus capsulatus]|uniref:Ribose-phosphate pyrophosphokinase n=1 Tax=Sphingoaurantiacus capsulatus TaxID=1771310 RepID=A0ABV7XCV2_9SPHN